VVQTEPKTECSFTPTVTNNSITRVYTWRNRVLQRALERLELPDAKVSWAVLRGRDGGNTTLLPDTDIKDSEWIADLLRHGLLKASFIPPKPIRDLRDLVRTHTHLVQERNRHINRIHKILETANIKLGSVVSDVVGKSARQMLEALIAGESGPLELAKLARGRMRPKIALLQQALQGHLEPHHRFLLSQTLAQLDFLQRRVGLLEQEVAERLSPFENSLALLMTIPGISRRSATILLSEIGTDMRAFPSAAHLASWVGICPGSHLSAGKRRSGKPTKGNTYLRSVLTQIAWVLTRMSDNYLSAQFHHLRPGWVRRKR